MSQGILAGVEKRVLSNGLTVLAHEDFSTPVACLHVFVRVGSNFESDDVWGWSHGIEHMLFKGTPTRGVGDIAREIRALGGSTNAATGYETTSYYIVLPADGFESALDIHADILARSAFREEDLDRERGVLIEELRMYQDVPDGFGFTWDELMKVMFTHHRYGKSVMGSVEALEKTPRDAILDYFRRTYVPANMVYAVAGAVEAERVFSAVEEKLGSLPDRPRRVAPTEPEPSQDAFRYVALHGAVEKAYFKIGYHVPEERHPDTPAMHVLGHLLGLGRSSRLYRNVVEKAGLASAIGLMEESGLDPGVLVVDGVTEPSDLEKTLVAVYQEIARFQREPVSGADLEKSLNNVQVEFMSALESVQGQAAIPGRFEALGDYRWAETYPDRVAAVTPADVMRVARAYLGFEQSSVLTYLPGDTSGPDRSQEGALGDRLRAAVPSADRLDPGEGSPTSAPDGAVASTSVGSGLRLDRAGGGAGELQSTTDSRGTTYIFRPNAKVPMVALAAYARAGIRFESADRQGLGTLTARTLIKGTATRSNDELAEELERYAITLVPFSDRDTMGFYLEATSRELPRALDLFADILLEPSFPVTEVERERAIQISDIEQEQDDTLTVTMDACLGRLFGDDPYGWNPLGRLDTVPRITREDVVGRHRRFLVAENLTFAAVGDLDPDHLIAELQKRLVDLGGGERPVPPPMSAWGRVEPSPILLDRDKAQSVVTLAMPAPTMHDDDRHAHMVLNAILSGMGGRLFAELRDRRHLCYYAGSYFSPFDSAGVFGAYVGTSPDRAEEALAAVREELDRARRDPPTDDEMIQAQNGLAGSHLIALQRNGSQAAAFARNQALGIDHRRVFQFPERIRAVTREDVMAAAHKTIDLDRAATAMLRPASGPGDPGAP